MAKQSMPDKDGPSLNPWQTPLPLWRYIVWILVLMALSWFWFGVGQAPERQELAYTEFKDRVREEQVASVVFKGQIVLGEFHGAIRQGPAAPVRGRVQESAAASVMFKTTLPPMDDPELIPLLEKHRVEVRAEVEQISWWASALINLLPWLLIIGLFFYASRKMQERMLGGGPGEIFGFGKSKARRFRKGSMEIGFDDVAGLENAKRDLHARVSCSWGRLGPARHCWLRQLRARPRCRSTVSAAPSSSRCLWVWALRACVICLTAPRKKRPLSSSSMR
jgi:cell division protease FtsH